ncbi:GAF domain-containing protein [Hymenobacter sp.]|jgi:GAF domain-containing protein|uniref:GAF domain-containing protein n=1 Tax=Hymenobacter sp. TaxID=1898978 RepID=UPI002EDB73F8
MNSFSSLIPFDDALRLEALHQYQHLSTLGEEFFDDLVCLTAKLFGAPIALVSFVEKDTVLFAGNVGLPGAKRVARHESLCSVAILHEETTVFESLADDPCVLVDPGVGQSLNLQFYAGHPLRTAEGHAIGSLCVIDRRARAFSASETKLLTSLAKVVMHLLELRARMAHAAEAAQTLWEEIYSRIIPPLARLQTLAELSGRHEIPDTTVVRFYHKAVREETTLIARILNEEVLASQSRLR